jgi:hypothetical protein
LRGLYRRTRETASDPESRQYFLWKGSVIENWAEITVQPAVHWVNYNNFTMVNPFCQRRPASIQVAPRRLAADRTPWKLAGSKGASRETKSPLALAGAETSRRRSCYAKFRLLLSPRPPWARPRWRDLRLGLVRMAPWLGWPAHRCRRTSLLWRPWRLLRAAAGADPLGSPLAPNQPLLLIDQFRPPLNATPRLACRGFFVPGNPVATFCFTTCKLVHYCVATGNKFRSCDLTFEI